jgi:hypothetical protein
MEEITRRKDLGELETCGLWREKEVAVRTWGEE